MASTLFGGRGGGGTQQGGSQQGGSFEYTVRTPDYFIPYAVPAGQYSWQDSSRPANWAIPLALLAVVGAYAVKKTGEKN
jgi:hypothetical protein